MIEMAGKRARRKLRASPSCVHTLALDHEWVTDEDAGWLLTSALPLFLGGAVLADERDDEQMMAADAEFTALGVTGVGALLVLERNSHCQESARAFTSPVH